MKQIKKKFTTETYIQKCKEIHGNKFDYSKTIYTGSAKFSTFICREHGEFEQRAADHIRTAGGCKQCAKKVISEKTSYTQDEILQKFKDVHGDRYDYSKVSYNKSTEKVEIVCKTHGIFLQTPSCHMIGQGCPICGILDKKDPRLIGLSSFIERSNIKHNNFYSYTKSEYINGITKTIVTCPTHGDFNIIPKNHMNGSKCPKCRVDENIKRNTHTLEKFIKKANKKHNFKYDYSNVQYSGTHNAVRIICKKHGEFLQKPCAHLHGSGCPTCGIFDSKGEKYIENILSSVKVPCLKNTRKIITPWEIDIYIPSLKVGVEFNGIYYHSEKNGGKNEFYHINKTELCEQKNISLLHIFEDELPISHAIKSKLFNLLGKHSILSSNISLREVCPSLANKFNKKYNLDSIDVSEMYNIGCFYKSRLIELYSIKNETIEQFCNISRFRIKNSINLILNYCSFVKFIKINRRFGDFKKYLSLGYEVEKIICPVTWYVVKNKRVSDPKNNLNYDRIWDCGHVILRIK